jgi:2-polyprenyl-3-methyl-5-hydroxy-6-metoxy-1,4-benzoquinol methylase
MAFRCEHPIPEGIATPAVLLCLVLLGFAMDKRTQASEQDRERWDSKFAASEYIHGKDPARFLEENVALLPSRARALDVAAGEGRNAVFLARQGLEVDAIDISEVGLEKARRLADEAAVAIDTIFADLTEYALPIEEYDLVVVFNYLERDLIGDIKGALKPGGIVVYETYTVQHLDIPHGHAMKREYLLEPGELREFFEDFEIIEYRETTAEHRAVASLIARKPTAQ